LRVRVVLACFRRPFPAQIRPSIALHAVRIPFTTEAGALAFVQAVGKVNLFPQIKSPNDEPVSAV